MKNSSTIRKTLSTPTAVAGQPALRTALWAALLANKGQTINEERLSAMQALPQPSPHSKICADILRKAQTNGFSSAALCASETTIPRIADETSKLSSGAYHARDAQLAGGVSATASSLLTNQFAQTSQGGSGRAGVSKSLPSALHAQTFQKRVEAIMNRTIYVLAAMAGTSIAITLAIHGPDIAREFLLK